MYKLIHREKVKINSHKTEFKDASVTHICKSHINYLILG